MRRVGLQARLDKLESKRRTGTRFRRVIYGVFGASVEDAIGFQAGNVHYMRADGESAHDAAQRAFESGSRVIGVILPLLGSGGAQEGVEALEPSQSPTDAPDACGAAPRDPFALTGIGRRASRAELVRMGVIANPPERLV